MRRIENPKSFLFDPAKMIRGKAEKIEIQRRIAEQGFLNQSRLDHGKGD
jgi:hypothetical protein